MLQSLINLFKPKPLWKRVIELHYQDNVLTVTTFDENSEQYYHKDTKWYRPYSHARIKDQSLINKLNEYYSTVQGGKPIRGGWVKRLRWPG